MERPEPSREPEDRRTGKVARAHLVAQVEPVIQVVQGEAETARPVLARAGPRAPAGPGVQAAAVVRAQSPAVVQTPATAVPMLADKAAGGPAEPPLVAPHPPSVRAARAGSASTM